MSASYWIDFKVPRQSPQYPSTDAVSVVLSGHGAQSWGAVRGASMRFTYPFEGTLPHSDSQDIWLRIQDYGPDDAYVHLGLTISEAILDHHPERPNEARSRLAWLIGVSDALYNAFHPVWGAANPEGSNSTILASFLETGQLRPGHFFWLSPAIADRLDRLALECRPAALTTMPDGGLRVELRTHGYTTSLDLPWSEDWPTE